jgi:hypothetical protein
LRLQEFKPNYKQKKALLQELFSVRTVLFCREKYIAILLLTEAVKNQKCK